MTEYPLQTDLSEENWTRLHFKDDMLIHVKKAFSQEDKAGGKAVELHSHVLMCTHVCVIPQAKKKKKDVKI